MQTPHSTSLEKPEPKSQFIKPTARHPTVSKHTTRESTTSRTSLADSAESYCYGKKRGRGFIQKEDKESSDLDSSDV